MTNEELVKRLLGLQTEWKNTNRDLRCLSSRVKPVEQFMLQDMAECLITLKLLSLEILEVERQLSQQPYTLVEL